MYIESDLHELLKKLKSGEIKPDLKLPGEHGKSSILGVTISSLVTLPVKEKYINSFLSYGCDVDALESGMTPLEIACMGGNNEPYQHIVNMMLQFHKKGDMSDLNVLKAAAKSTNWGMFENVIASGAVDLNATRLGGTHILHYLASEPTMSSAIGVLVNHADELDHSPINRKGHSPMAVAINVGNKNGIELFKFFKDAKIIGKLEKPSYVVAYDAVDRYDGNFWEDYPEMIKVAVNMGKFDLLPKPLADIFIF